MSEGSSDGEGAEEDLSPEQTNYIMQMIKGGKCGSMSRTSMRKKSKQSSRKTTEDHTEERTNKEESEDRVFLKNDEIDSSEVFRCKRAINIRKPYNQSKEKISSIE